MMKESISSEASSVKEDLASPTSSVGSSEATVPPSSMRQIDILCQTADIVRAVLYSTQENVLTIYEIFRQVSKVLNSTFSFMKWMTVL